MTEAFVKAVPPLPNDFPPNKFANATEIEPTANANVYTTDLKRDWCIGLVPNGGYLAAVITSAAKEHFLLRHPDLKQPDLITLHQEFISPCTVGPAEIAMTELSLGRQYSAVRVQLYQCPNDDHTKQAVLRIEALIRQGNIGRENASGGISLPTQPMSKFGLVPDRADCTEYKDEPAIFVRRTAYAKVVMMLSPDVAGSDKNACPRPSVSQQWITLRDEAESFDIAGLCYIADIFRPLVEWYGVTGNWFPTLNMSVEVKKAPPRGGWKWLFMRVEAHQIKDGRFDMDVVILDQEGELVALSKHAALAVPSERNYKRSGPSKM